MEKPYIVDHGKLAEDLRDVLKKHGWSASDAYDLAQDIVKSILLRK